MTEAEAQSSLPTRAGAASGVIGGADRALERWRMVLAAVAMTLTPIVAYSGNLGFAPLAAGLGIASLLFLGRRGRPSLGVAVLLLMVIWAVASMSWSPATPRHVDFHRYKSVEAVTGLKLPFQLAFYASFVTAMLKLPDRAADRVSLILAVGMAVMAAVLALEAFSGAPIYQAIKAALHQHTRPDLAQRNVARACYVGMVLFWPVVLRLGRLGGKLALIVFIAGLALATARFAVDSPILAFFVSGGVFLVVRQFGRPAIWGLIVAAAAYFALAPLVIALADHVAPAHAAVGVGKQSWGARLEIWRFAAARIAERPGIGWGLDASRAWPTHIPLHPHDAALQLWLELGATGVALTSVFWGWLFSRIAEREADDRIMAAAACACACAYLTIGALSFGVWQEWWLGVGAVAIVVCAFVGKARRFEAAEHPPSGELVPIA